MEWHADGTTTAGRFGVGTPRSTARASSRSFDPVLAGRLECDAWVAYYRRDWLAFLRAGLRVGRLVFGLSWRATFQCSWLVLRANQLWAPFPDNDAERSRRMMERFYRIVQRLYDDPFDPAVAAELEVDWWRVHRQEQHAACAPGSPSLVDALARLYAYVYDVPKVTVRPAAEERARAMRLSDRWVADGCDPDSDLIASERVALIRSYTALLGAITAPRATSGAAELARPR